MARRHKDLGFEESFFNNMEDYEVIKGRLFDLACGCFSFENLPSNVIEIVDKLLHMNIFTSDPAKSS